MGTFHPQNMPEQSASSKRAESKGLQWFRRFTYRLYYRSYPAMQRWQDRITNRGWFVMGFTVFAAVVSLPQPNRTMAYQLFAFLFCLIFMGFVTTPFLRNRFRAQRNLPRFATAGSDLQYTVTLKNESHRHYRQLTVEEVLPLGRPSYDQFLHVPRPGEQYLNPFDRFFRYPRWEYLVEQNRLARFEPVTAFPLRPGEQRKLTLTLHPVRRGVLRLRGIRVLKWDAFGLFRGDAWAHCGGADLVILPRRYKLPLISLGGADRFQTGASQITSARGEADEFVSLRDYRPGDPPRHIHWRSWARLGRPIVKEFEREFYPRNALLLDTFVPPGLDDLFEEAVSVAASFAFEITRTETTLDLLYVGHEPFVLTAGRGEANLEKLLEVLASVEPLREDPMDHLRKLVLPRLAALSGCIVVFSTWDAARAQLVQELLARDLTVVPLLITPPPDTNLPGGQPDQAPPEVYPLQAGRIEGDLAKLEDQLQVAPT